MANHGPRVVVIGAGMGGLACAADLARRGADVTVLERAPVSGGKIYDVALAGRRVDAGPTTLTMPWVLDELFGDAGRSFRDELSLERATILARCRWADGLVLDLHADRERAADAIGAAFGAGAARAYRTFMDDTRRMYEVSEDTFLRTQRLSLTGIMTKFGSAGLSTLTKLESHKTMWRVLEERFADPRLRQLFARYAAYSGCSPHEAPGTLSLVAHVEADGLYRVRGGFGALVDAVVSLALAQGARIRHDTRVDRLAVERGRVRGVWVGSERIAADAVVFNGDVGALGAGHLGPEAAGAAPPVPRSSRSSSAMTWATLVTPLASPALVHQNVFFPRDGSAETDRLFRQEAMALDPTALVVGQDRDDTGTPPTGDRERLSIVVAAPPTGDAPGRWGPVERERATRAMAETLRRAGLDLDLDPDETLQTSPAELDDRFPGAGGGLYGPRSKGARAVLARAAAGTRLPGLYLAGGSIHPGPGVAMSALSGRLAAEKILEDRGRDRQGGGWLGRWVPR